MGAVRGLDSEARCRSAQTPGPAGRPQQDAWYVASSAVSDSWGCHSAGLWPPGGPARAPGAAPAGAAQAGTLSVASLTPSRSPSPPRPCTVLWHSLSGSPQAAAAVRPLGSCFAHQRAFREADGPGMFNNNTCRFRFFHTGSCFAPRRDRDAQAARRRVAGVSDSESTRTRSSHWQWHCGRSADRPTAPSQAAAAGGPGAEPLARLTPRLSRSQVGPGCSVASLPGPREL